MYEGEREGKRERERERERESTSHKTHTHAYNVAHAHNVAHTHAHSPSFVMLHTKNLNSLDKYNPPEGIHTMFMTINNTAVQN